MEAGAVQMNGMRIVGLIVKHQPVIAIAMEGMRLIAPLETFAVDGPKVEVASAAINFAKDKVMVSSGISGGRTSPKTL